MNDLFNALIGLLSGLFGLLLGLAYFLPVVLLLIALIAFTYLRRRRGRSTVFSAQEPEPRDPDSGKPRR